MAGFALDISGFDNLEKRLSRMKKALKEDVQNELSSSVLKISRDAKKLAPVNLGNLRNSITAVSDINGMTHRVIVNASYGPYVEFGTGSKVSIPDGYADYAQQFRGGANGTYYDFLLAIAEWVRKKGIKGGVYNISTKRRLGGKARKFDEDVAVAERIAYSILKKGIRAQPFLFPAYEAEKPKMFERLYKLLK